MSTPQSTFEIELKNHPGALSHVVGLFARRACNVEKLVCLPSDTGTTSRLWIATEAIADPARMARFVAGLEDVVTVRVGAETRVNTANRWPILEP